MSGPAYDVSGAAMAKYLQTLTRPDEAAAWRRAKRRERLRASALALLLTVLVGIYLWAFLS